MLTNKEIKQRYFNKVLENALDIECACGCKTFIKNKDKYGRDKKFVSGHNTPVKYEDPTQYKREWNHRNRQARYQYRKQYHKIRRLQLIGLYGNKCMECGVEYNGNNAGIFHFHHLNPKTKDFTIGNKMTVLAWATLLAEAEKCIMICANCHELKHGGNY